MRRRRQRMLFAGVILAGVAAAAALAVRGLGENMLFFFSPSQIAAGEVPAGQSVRVGGLVVRGSVARDSGLGVRFALSDGAESVLVRYEGILPDLFREGQGIVARGRLLAGGEFAAEEVLAKHDENYMPPEVAEALEIAREGGQVSAAAADADP